MGWSARARSVWGKIDPESDSWMPLVRHLEDTSAVADWLWEEFLPRGARRVVQRALGSASDEEARCLAVWLASVHDVGKISPAFSAKATYTMPAVLDVMRDYGLDAHAPVPEHRLAPHATVGQLALDDWLAARWPQSSRRTRTTYTAVVGCHHGTTPSGYALTVARDHPHFVGVGPWHDVRTEVLDAFAKSAGADQFLDRWVTHPLSLPAQTLLSGFVIMADWIASNTDFFPLNVLDASDQRIEVAFDRLDLPRPWSPRVPDGTVEDQFLERFPALVGSKPRPLQTALAVAARETEDPELFIVEGPMGVGKTEAALLAAEILAERFGLGGVFVGLPTMATANPMFERVRDWLATALNGEDASLALAHGKAALNDTYVGLLNHPWSGEVYDESADGGETWAASVVVNNWLRGRKRNGLADFVVGTIDQSLFAALKAKHVVLRHLGLAGKVVIIDEVHAADEYMRVYLGVLLEWLGAYRVPVILMSATLPPDQRDEFLSAYSRGTGVGGASLRTDRTDRYPRITATEGTSIRSIEVEPEDSQPMEISVVQVADDLDVLVDDLRTATAEGGCVGVLCNTVGRAQAAYDALRDQFGDEVILVHSRFIAPDRARREAELVRLLGPRSTERPQRLIVVGTQVLEQSLDVDFDLLVTDLAPADLILQRAGRLHRHLREARPGPLAAPHLWIRGVEDWSQSPPQPVRGSRAVYRNARLLRAAAVHAGLKTICIPTDVAGIVRRAYDPALTVPKGWEDQWSAAVELETNSVAKSVARAKTYLMPGPRSQRDLNGLIDVRAGDPESSEERGASQVRDSEDGLEVITLWRDPDGVTLRLPECAPRFPGQVVPQGLEWGTDEARLARDLASCTLRLPMSLTRSSEIDDVIAELEKTIDYSLWLRSPWLSGQLALVFDSSGCCRLAGRRLSYDSDRGLQVVEEQHS